MTRTQGILWIALVVAVGETLAAVAVRTTETELLIAQLPLALAFAALLFLIPVPARWLPVLPVFLIGCLHLQGLGPRNPWPSLMLLGVLHAIGSAAILRLTSPGGRAADRARGRIEPRALLIGGAAYVAQAFWCARLLFPNERAPVPSEALVLLTCTTLAPLAAAGAAAAWLRSAPARALGAVAAAALFAAPLVAHWPLILRWHSPARYPPTARGDVAAPPDVLMLVMDTTRADRMSLYGHPRPTTPNLEAFAERATTYERAISQGIWTLPGHAAMFTGLYPSEIGDEWDVGGRAGRLPSEVVTIAERLRIEGYQTACVASNHLFGAPFGLTQGFELVWAESSLSEHLALPRIARQVVHAVTGGRHTARQRIGPLERGEHAPAREIHDVALRWFDATDGASPRFLFVNLMEPHGQLRREPCDAPIFGDGRAWCEYDVANYDDVLADRSDGEPSDLKRLEDWYDSELACMDHHIGELFAELDARGVLDSMLVVVVADHGEMLGDHRAFNHKGEVWEGLVHVPLLIKLPGQTEGARCSAVCETSSLASTIPMLLGLPPLDGVPAWAGTLDHVPAALRTPPRFASAGGSAPCPLPGRSPVAVSHAGRHRKTAERYPDATRWDRHYFALRDGDLKFVVDSSDSQWISDLAAEPAEVPRAPSADEEAHFAQLFEAWQASLHARPLESALSVEDQAERLRAQRALGYVGEDP